MVGHRELRSESGRLPLWAGGLAPRILEAAVCGLRSAACGVRGLTLVEILVSLAILSTSIVLILQAQVSGVSALTLAEQRLAACTLARSKMADLELGFHRGELPRPEGQLRVGRTAFRWRTETAPLPEDPQLEQVTLTVDWRYGRHDYASAVTTLRYIAEDQRQNDE